MSIFAPLFSSVETPKDPNILQEFGRLLIRSNDYILHTSQVGLHMLFGWRQSPSRPADDGRKWLQPYLSLLVTSLWVVCLVSVVRHVGRPLPLKLLYQLCAVGLLSSLRRLILAPREFYLENVAFYLALSSSFLAFLADLARRKWEEAPAHREEAGGSDDWLSVSDLFHTTGTDGERARDRMMADGPGEKASAGFFDYDTYSRNLAEENCELGERSGGDSNRVMNSTPVICRPRHVRKRIHEAGSRQRRGRLVRADIDWCDFNEYLSRILDKNGKSSLGDESGYFGDTPDSTVRWREGEERVQVTPRRSKSMNNAHTRWSPEVQPLFPSIDYLVKKKCFAFEY